MFAHPFIAILDERDTRRIALGGLVGRLREGGTGLGIVLAVREVTGSYATAGVAVAAYLAGGAVSRPLHGRWADRSTTARVLLIPSAINALALVGLAAAAWRDAATSVLLALATLVGLTLPALSAVLRSLWPQLSSESAEHAYAFDTLLWQASLVLSPPLVGFLAVALSPSAALIALAVAGSAGTFMVVHFSTGLSAAKLDGGHGRRGLMTAPLALLAAVSLWVGFSQGSLTVIVPAFASKTGTPGASGLLLSALAAGSLVGALAYGSVAHSWAWPRRLVACTAALAATFLAIAAIHPGVVLFGILLTLSGLALAPTLTTALSALQIEAPAPALIEAFTWSSFSTSVGAAAGQALAGLLTGGVGVRTALWEPAVGTGIALVFSAMAIRVSAEPVRIRRSLRRR